MAKPLATEKSESDSGSWTARRYVSGTKYEFHVIGLSDDNASADGITLFDYSKAKAKAEKWFAQRKREDDGQVAKLRKPQVQEWLQNLAKNHR